MYSFNKAYASGLNTLFFRVFLPIPNAGWLLAVFEVFLPAFILTYMLTLYRVLSYLLLPFALFLSFMAALLLLTAFGNISALLPLFIVGATVIYLFSSLSFIHRGVLPNMPVKASMKDWIRVNAFVTLFFGASFVFQGIYLRGNEAFMEEVQRQMASMSKQIGPEAMAKINLKTLIATVLNVILIIGSLLVAHVLIGLAFLKKYAHLFSGGSNP